MRILVVNGGSSSFKCRFHEVANEPLPVEALAPLWQPRAGIAFDTHTRRLCRGIGAMLAVLGRVDALAFTGGVGENCAPLRERVCQFDFLGLCLDLEKNSQHEDKDEDIATPESSVRMLLIRAGQDWEIARECYRYAAGKGIAK
jgi:acetate kinase